MNKNPSKNTFVGQLATAKVSASCAASVFDVTPER